MGRVEEEESAVELLEVVLATLLLLEEGGVVGVGEVGAEQPSSSTPKYLGAVHTDLLELLVTQ